MFMCLEYRKRLDKLKKEYHSIKDKEADIGKLFEYYKKIIILCLI